jgi:hypothetical protein
MERPKEERLAELYRRLGSAPAAASLNEARDLIARTLADVEDEMTEIPNCPENWESDGRMYPIQDDNWRKEENGVLRGRSRAHHTFVGPNGAVRITTLDGDTQFEKPGADGEYL